jgi:hypothetical protein
LCLNLKIKKFQIKLWLFFFHLKMADGYIGNYNLNEVVADVIYGDLVGNVTGDLHGTADEAIHAQTADTATHADDTYEADYVLDASQPYITTLPNLVNIQSTALPNTVWPFVSTLNQNVATTSSPTFVTVNANLNGNATTATHAITANSADIVTDASQPNITTLPNLVNIQSTALPNTVWPFVSTLNQNVATTSSPTFVTVNANLNGNATTANTANYITDSTQPNITTLPNLVNIQSTVLPNTVWPFVATLNQNVSSTSSPLFRACQLIGYAGLGYGLNLIGVVSQPAPSGVATLKLASELQGYSTSLAHTSIDVTDSFYVGGSVTGWLSGMVIDQVFDLQANTTISNYAGIRSLEADHINPYSINLTNYYGIYAEDSKNHTVTMENWAGYFRGSIKATTSVDTPLATVTNQLTSGAIRIGSGTPVGDTSAISINKVVSASSSSIVGLYNSPKLVCQSGGALLIATAQLIQGDWSQNVGTIQNAYNCYISNTNNTGTISNATQLYIAPMTYGTTKTMFDCGNLFKIRDTVPTVTATKIVGLNANNEMIRPDNDAYMVNMNQSVTTTSNVQFASINCGNITSSVSVLDNVFIMKNLAGTITNQRSYDLRIGSGLACNYLNIDALNDAGAVVRNIMSCTHAGNVEVRNLKCTPGFVLNRASNEIIGDSNGNIGTGAKVYGDNGVGDAPTPQLLIVGLNNSAQRLSLAYDTSNNCGVLQAVQSGVSVRPMKINPGGGDIYFNTLITASNQTTLYINTSTGLVSRATSSRKFKKNIRQRTVNTGNILLLEAKEFEYKKEEDGSDIGWIAEEVHENGLTYLVNYDAKGEPESVKYDKATVYIVEELKKLKQDIFDLKVENALLKQQISVLQNTKK